MTVLRDYQRKQISFLEEHLIDYGNFFRFDNNIALESPTGSGKTFTVLSFIQSLFDNNDDSKVFFATGYNKLIPQIAVEADKMGIPYVILAGRSNTNCIKKIEMQGLTSDYSDIASKAFSFEDKEFHPSNLMCSKCELKKLNSRCLYSRVLSKIKSPGNLLVITNHSTYLHRKDDVFFTVCDLGFIDECQVFPNFYQLYNTYSIDPSIFYSVQKHLDNLIAKNKANPSTFILSSMLAQGIKNGNVSPETFDKAMNVPLLEDSRMRLADKYSPLVLDAIREWMDTDPTDDDVFVHPLVTDGRFTGVKIEKFKAKFTPSIPVCLMSATVDKYTRQLFDVKPKNLYKETECKLFDYTQSKLEIYNSCDDKTVEAFLESQSGEHGIFYSTRLDLVDDYMQYGYVGGYEMINSVDKFVKGKKQVLVGSNSIMQGIDLPDISFVMINRIPFPRYDSAYKKKSSYIEKINKEKAPYASSEITNSYNSFTIPFTENSLIQAMGRLWRKPGDKGTVALFDGRACEKHAGIIEEVCSYRDGIIIEKKF